MADLDPLVDLHTHSAVSDGTDTPAELVAAARAAGIDVLALTDHDSVAGWDPAVAALPAGTTLVRGAELSCTESVSGVDVHLLAYLFDPDTPRLARELVRLQGERVRRIRAMARRMQEAGLPVDAEEIMASAGPSVGRPHIGEALIRAGVVADMTEAFAGPLSRRGGFHEPKHDTELVDAVAMVAEAGGVSVLAHVRASSRGAILDDATIARLAGAGVRGIEVDHHLHDPADRAHLRDLAATLGLVPTGSSDYHGTNKTVRLAQESTTPENLERLLDGAIGVDVVQGARSRRGVALR